MKKINLILIFLCCSQGYIYSQTWSSVGININGYIAVFFTDTINDLLYAGGLFDKVGTTSASNVVQWNGTKWTALGSGIQYDITQHWNVEALAIYKGELYAGGYFTTASGNSTKNIAKWNGSNWNAVGAGIINDINQVYVSSLAVYKGELYVGGFFTKAGGISTNDIAKWDGSNWSTVGNTGTNTGTITALAIYNNELYATGHFDSIGGIAANNIAKWDGTKWSAVGLGVSAFPGQLMVEALKVYKGELYVGGTFTVAGGISTNNVAKWNGTQWSVVDGGVQSDVSIMEVYHGVLYAGGAINKAGSISTKGIAAWDGINWSALGSGVDSGASALAVYHEELYVGGLINTAGGIKVGNIAKWSAPTSINENVQGINNNVILYPNPAENELNIVLNTDGTQEYTTQMLNILGQTVYKQTFSKATKLDVSNLNKGLYFIEVRNSITGEQQLQKVVVR